MLAVPMCQLLRPVHKEDIVFRAYKEVEEEKREVSKQGQC